MSPYCSETKFADLQLSNGAQLLTSGRTLFLLLLFHEMPTSGPCDPLSYRRRIEATIVGSAAKGTKELLISSTVLT